MPAFGASIASPTVPSHAGPLAGQLTASAALPSLPTASDEPVEDADAAPLGRTVRPVTPSITVTGGVVSTRNVHSAGVGSGLPAASIARASKRCSPSASTSLLYGDVQANQAPPSSRHCSFEPASPARTSNSGRLSRVTFFGPLAITVF